MMIHRNAFCWCGSGKKWKKCHYPDDGSSLDDPNKKKYWDKYQIILKTPEQIEGIRHACQITSQILEHLCSLAQEGVTTRTLDTECRRLAKEAGAICASLNYGEPPYPNALCTSLNEVICHGIPNDTPLQKGDIVNLDLGLIVDGYFGDCSKMVAIGVIEPAKQKVVDCSYEALMASIALLKPGVLISQIGDCIEKIAQERNCSVVDQFVGHGVGLQYHEQPQVPHCKNRVHIPLVPNMIFTIEPMINAGKKEGVIDPIDHWTARTIDNLPSAQWEHTLLITETGHEILTTWKR
jgi:methionyl aminopeptidase